MPGLKVLKCILSHGYDEINNFDDITYEKYLQTSIALKFWPYELKVWKPENHQKSIFSRGDDVISGLKFSKIFLCI